MLSLEEAGVVLMHLGIGIIVITYCMRDVPSVIILIVYVVIISVQYIGLMY